MGSGFSFHMICIFSLCIVHPSFMETSKRDRSPWIKSTKKPGPNEQKAKVLLKKGKKSLAESHKGSCFSQFPL